MDGSEYNKYAFQINHPESQRLGLPGPLSVLLCGEVDFRMCLGAGQALTGTDTQLTTAPKTQPDIYQAVCKSSQIPIRQF